MKNRFNPGKMKIKVRLSDDPFEEVCRPVSCEILLNTGADRISEAEAYRRLGCMYYDGLGIEQDEIKGCRYFETAYDKGCRDIRNGDYLMMGVYRHIEIPEAVSEGLTRDLRLAIRWYACFLEQCIRMEDEHGINLALSHLGRAFMDDDIRDYKSAYICLSKACEQEPEAMFYLAMMYDRGLYVEKNHEKAEYYINRILETPAFEGDVFYDTAQAIRECWEMGMPEEIIDEIVYGLG